MSRALGYALLSGLCIGLVFGGVALLIPAERAWSGTTDEPVRRVLTAGIMTLVCGVGVSSRALMRSVIFHVVARACGSRKTFRWSLWGLSYLSAAEFLWAIAALLGRFGNPALILVLCSITIEVWTSLQATVLAQEHHGLELRRATLAGWATWVVYALCLTCSCALTSAPISLVAATP